MDTCMLRNIIERYEAASFTINRMMDAAISDCLPDNLTPDQGAILRFVQERGTCTSSELADQFKVSRSSVTAIINRLADKGLVMRKTDDQDRRVTYLSLTAAGKQVFEVIQARIEQVLSKYLNQFTSDEAQTFITVYEKLAAILLEEERRQQS